MLCYHCMKELNAENVKFCPFCGKAPHEQNPPHHLPEGTILHGKYIVGNALGEGGFGITYVGLDNTLDLKIAIKEFFPSGYANRNATVSKEVSLNYNNQTEYFKHGKESFLREAKSIAKFSSEDGIVDVRDYFTENSTAYIVMEYLDGETLSSYTRDKGKLDAEELFRMMLPIMHSLEKMHNEKVIHRDISPDNIMYLKSGSLKLMDFGAARYFAGSEQKTMSVMLKPGFAPYEQYSSNGKQGPWTDVYGMCATIYKCITGVTPPDSLDRAQNDTLKKPSELGVSISPALENVLMYGLAIYHENRCQDMNELLRITEKALRKEAVAFQSNDSSVNENIDRVKAADERYKTMFAEDSFEPASQNAAPPQQRRQQPQAPQQPPQQQPQNNWGYPPYVPQQPQQPQPPQKKSNTAVIIAVISVSLVILLGCGAFAFMMFNNKSDSSDNEETTAASLSAAVTDTTLTVGSTQASAPDADSTAIPTPPPEVTTDSPVETTTELPPITPYVQPTTEKRAVSDATYFSSASASSTLPNQQTYNYSPSNVLKNDSSCWCEGASGSGVGEWIRLDLPETQNLYGITLLNGYVGTDDQYNNNGKISKVTLEFSNGQTLTCDLSVYPAKQRSTVQLIKFNQAIETDYVKITIDDVVDGQKFDDTCLTYVAPYTE